MLARRSSQGRLIAHGVALALAYLLVVQALVFGFSSGLQAAPAADGTAWVLCSATGGSGSNPDAPQPAGHADCCVLGCTMFGPCVAPPVEAATLLPARTAVASAILAPREHGPLPSSDRSPRSTRGPPRAV